MARSCTADGEADRFAEFRDIEAEMAELEAAGRTESLRYKALKRKLNKPPSTLGTWGPPMQQIRQHADRKLRRAAWRKRRAAYGRARED